ncbi:hypothetical protein [Nocardia carnea]|uniref:hypothetical protein n=1 Tax=Nocardia carnea TaxID=37328 RepID=UPI002457D60E|nr:hypothetical protein [Nocardia carnea]
MYATAERSRRISRTAGAIVGVAAVFAAAGSPVVVLNDYCAEQGAVAYLEDGRTVYCSQVAETDAFVWSYSRQPMPLDPNTRGYSCDADGCRYPDGSEVPGAQRCGILCGEPPTSGDVQSGLAECFNSGAPFDECEGRLPG